MRSAPFTFAISCLALAAAACGGGSSGGTDDGGARGDEAPAADEVVTTDASPGGVRGAIEVMAAAPGDAGDAACGADRQTLATAVEVYAVMNGAPPSSQQDLLDAQMVTELSPWFEITTEGEIVPAPGSPCT